VRIRVHNQLRVQNTGTVGFPGLNGRIAFDRGGDIRVMNADGSHVVDVSNNSSQSGRSDAQPRWSPDGSRIVFQRFTLDGHSQIFTINADGTSVTSISGGGFDDYDPSWSPDGSKIAFSRYDPDTGHNDIWTMNANGTDKTRLTANSDGNGNGNYDDQQPAWAPDTPKIAFTRCCPGDHTQIYTMTTSGGTLTDISSPTANDTDPNWSPNGALLAFASSGGIWTMTPTGANRVNVTHGHPGDGPSWSPDGSKIAFDVDVSGTSHIDTMTAAGASITDIGVGDHPDWGSAPAAQPPGVPQYHVGTPFAKLGRGAAPTIPSYVDWTASPSANLCSYQLRRRVDGVGFSAVTLSSPLARRFATTVLAGHSYQFEVRAETCAGRLSQWSINAPFEVSMRQQAPAAYTGSWTTRNLEGSWGGTVATTTERGASVSWTVTARNIGVVGARGHGYGSFQEYIDGALVQTVSGHASTLQPREIIARWGWSTPGTHTIKLVNLATSGHPRLDIDGLIVFR
jgi:WD40-like Beta Propeller Repeat